MQKMQIKNWYMMATIMASISFPFLGHAEIQRDTIKTLLGSTRLNTIGIAISPEIGSTTYAGSYTSVAGLGASLIFNNRFSLGVAVSGTTDKTFTPTALDPNGQLHLTARQAALRLEYTYSPAKLLHVSFPLTAGINRVLTDSLNHDTEHAIHGAFGGRGGFRQGQQTGFVQPAVHAELNILKYMRLYAGLGYRITVYNDESRADHPLTTDQLNGLTMQAGLKLGLFDLSVRKKKDE